MGGEYSHLMPQDAFKAFGNKLIDAKEKGTLASA